MHCLETKLFEPTNNYYVDTADKNFSKPALSGEHRTQTLIIGGGFAGLGAAISLLERDHTNTTVIEAKQIGFGASGRNGGFVFGGFSLGETQLAKQLGAERARWAYGLTRQAVETIKERITRYAISCETTYEGVILANWFNETHNLQAKQQFMKTVLDTDWQWLSFEDIRALINSNRYYNGLYETNAFHFHPLKYAQGLAKALIDAGVELFEHTPALSVHPSKDQVLVKTPEGQITCENLIICCGGYMSKFYQPIHKAILPISTYVMVTEPLGDQADHWLPSNAAIYDTRFAFDYYRKLIDKRLLWGGRISIARRSPAQIQHLLRKDLTKVFPELGEVKIDYAWGGLMGYPRHKMPFVGFTHPRVWHNTGFGGHGVGPTTAGGELVAAAVLGENQEYQQLKQYQPAYAFGSLGLLASQFTYWGYIASDLLRERMRK